MRIDLGKINSGAKALTFAKKLRKRIRTGDWSGGEESLLARLLSDIAKPINGIRPEDLRLDPNDGGMHTKAEFVAVYGGSQEWDAAAPPPVVEPEVTLTSLERMEQAWADIDADGSGSLDRNEARALLRQMGFVTYPDLKAAIKALDENGDGEISKDEFTNWFSQQDPEQQSKVEHERGMIFEIGGKKVRLSAGGEIEAVTERLRDALDADNVMIIGSAVQAARHLFNVLGGGAPTEAKQLLLQLQRKLQDDDDLRRQDRLYNCAPCRDALQRLWDLLKAASAAEQHTEAADAGLGKVSLAGYQQMHMRVAIAITVDENDGDYPGRDPDTGEFNEGMAKKSANGDWGEDINRFR